MYFSKIYSYGQIGVVPVSQWVINFPQSSKIHSHAVNTPTLLSSTMAEFTTSITLPVADAPDDDDSDEDDLQPAPLRPTEPSRRENCTFMMHFVYCRFCADRYGKD